MLSKWIDGLVKKSVLNAARRMTDSEVDQLVPLAERVKEQMKVVARERDASKKKGGKK